MFSERLSPLYHLQAWQGTCPRGCSTHGPADQPQQVGDLQGHEWMKIWRPQSTCLWEKYPPAGEAPPAGSGKPNKWAKRADQGCCSPPGSQRTSALRPQPAHSPPGFPWRSVVRQRQPCLHWNPRGPGGHVDPSSIRRPLSQSLCPSRWLRDRSICSTSRALRGLMRWWEEWE